MTVMEEVEKAIKEFYRHEIEDKAKVGLRFDCDGKIEFTDSSVKEKDLSMTLLDLINDFHKLEVKSWIKENLKEQKKEGT